MNALISSRGDLLRNPRDSWYLQRECVCIGWGKGDGGNSISQELCLPVISLWPSSRFPCPYPTMVSVLQKDRNGTLPLLCSNIPAHLQLFQPDLHSPAWCTNLAKCTSSSLGSFGVHVLCTCSSPVCHPLQEAFTVCST